MSNEKHKNLENLDLHTPYPTGVLLSRPTSPANAKCPFYYATDTNVLYWHNGSTWIAMTGVITPTIEQSMYTPFAINSGNVDSSGNADILEIDGSISGKLNFKVGGSNYISLTATTATGSTFTLSSISSISMATYADGTWEIFVNAAGTILVLPNAITRSKVFPASPVNGAVHLDTSKELLQAAKYDGSAWQLFNSVHLGTVVVASGVITSVITAPYNYNGYTVNNVDVTRQMVIAWLPPDVSTAVSVLSTAVQTADNNMWLYVRYSAQDDSTGATINMGASNPPTQEAFRSSIMGANVSISSWIFIPKGYYYQYSGVGLVVMTKYACMGD